MDWSELTQLNANFLPHGYCLLWRPGLLWTLVGSDAIIALSYFSIPITLIYFLRRQPQIQFRAVFAMFAAFILACGLTHLIEIANIWQPLYSLSAGVKAFTAMVSVMTAVALWHLAPEISRFIDGHRQLQTDLELRNAELDDALRLAREREHRAMDSENQFRTTQQQAPVGIATVSLEGNFISVNPALANMLGYEDKELLQMTFQQITHADDLDTDLAHVQALIDGRKQSYSMEKRYWTRQGEIVHVQLDVTLLRDNFGQPQHFVSMIQNITQAKETQTALRRSRSGMQQLLHELPLGIVIFNPDGSIDSSNASASEMLCLHCDTASGRLQLNHHWQFVDRQGQKLAKDAFPVRQVLRLGEPVQDQILGLQRGDEDIRWLKVHAFLKPAEQDNLSQVVVSLTRLSDDPRGTAEPGTPKR